jgi:hypothetical protein
MNFSIKDIGLSVLSASIKARVTREIRWNSFPGSVVHGVIGYKLKDLSCVVAHRNCVKCYLVQTCPYASIYESLVPPDAERMRLYPQTPHPLRIAVYPWDKPILNAGDEFEVNIVLFGKAANFLLPVLLAAESSFQEGVGRKHGGDRGRAEILSIKDRISNSERSWMNLTHEYVNFISSVPLGRLMRGGNAGQTTIHIRTPLKLITGGKVNLNPGVRDLVSTLLRRIANLSYFYAGKEISLDFRGILARAEFVRSSNHLRRARAIRYSARQSKTIGLGGVIGEMRIEDCPEEIVALLEMGQHIGVGRGTTMGLGDYFIE